MSPDAPTSQDGFVPLDESMAEVSLLVPGWQIEAVAEQAHSQGMTAGQFLRVLLQQALKRFAICRSQGFHTA
jgi:hypothetical protein